LLTLKIQDAPLGGLALITVDGPRKPLFLLAPIDHLLLRTLLWS